MKITHIALNLTFAFSVPVPFINKRKMTSENACGYLDNFATFFTCFFLPKIVCYFFPSFLCQFILLTSNKSLFVKDIYFISKDI